MYETGDGVPQDYRTAVKWYGRAAEKGDAYAQRNLQVLQKTETVAEISRNITMVLSRNSSL